MSLLVAATSLAIPTLDGHCFGHAFHCLGCAGGFSNRSLHVRCLAGSDLVRFLDGLAQTASLQTKGYRLRYKNEELQSANKNKQPGESDNLPIVRRFFIALGLIGLGFGIGL
jgi:hypothetical protein